MNFQLSLKQALIYAVFLQRPVFLVFPLNPSGKLSAKGVSTNLPLMYLSVKSACWFGAGNLDLWWYKVNYNF